MVAPEEAIPEEAIEAAEKMDIEAIATRYDAAFRDRDRQTAAAWESARDVPGLVGRVAELAAQRQAVLDLCHASPPCPIKHNCQTHRAVRVSDLWAALGVTGDEELEDSGA